MKWNRFFCSSFHSHIFGTVASKTIEVRIAASAGVGSPSGNVVCSSTGATSQNVAVSGTVTAPIVAPTTQASNISFGSIGQNGMTTSWTNGDGAKRVVIINTSNSFTDPADCTDPTANTAYSGSGQQVVYNNSSNSVTVTGLSASTTYWFRVYEYNGSGATTKYLTDAGTNNPNSQATASPPPNAPEATAATSATLTGFTANWNAVSGASGYKLDVSTLQNFDTQKNIIDDGLNNSLIAFSNTNGTFYTGSSTSSDSPTSTTFVLKEHIVLASQMELPFLHQILLTQQLTVI